MAERKKILWLVSWYPNKFDPFDGDFIQRHAKAAALYDDIHVLFIKSSTEQQTVERKKAEGDGLIEEIIYLPKGKSTFKKITSFIHWQKTFRSAAKEIIQTQKPDLVHVHIPWKAGLIALWIKKRFNIPFLVTEHWGIYNSVVDDSINTKPFIVRYLLKKVYKQATSFISVSHFLGEGVNRTLVRKEFDVIPNVVDTQLFHPSTVKFDRFTFLHVSNMVPLKNVEGILEAFASFHAARRGAAQLVLIGNRDNHSGSFLNSVDLPEDSVTYMGEVSYAEVAAAMKRSHILLINSDIENSPCVIGEALCCGLPVIATDVGGIPELVDQSNSILIEKRNPRALTEAMLMALDRYPEYNHGQIAADAHRRFKTSVVGQQFHDLYR